MRSLERLDVSGKRVLVRVDFNVPLSIDADGELQIADDTRIRAGLASIEELRGRGARVVLVSHLGRPEGTPIAGLSLAPVARRVEELIGADVTLAPAVVGEEVRMLTEAMQDGEILVLENVRFEVGETSNDPAFARELEELADIYVDDAFGMAHRAHASTEGIAHLLPSAAGRLLEREVATLTKILQAPDRPLVAIVGGSKVADKIAVIDRFLQVADVVMIGGAMCFPFLRAQGHAVGDSLCDEEDVEHAAHALQRASDTHSPQPGRARLLVPDDLVIGDRLAVDAEHRVLHGVEVPKGWMGLDCGPKSIALFDAAIRRAKTIVWNGPSGVFEFEKFAGSTKAMAAAIAESTAHGATTVVGGGDTATATRKFKVADKVTHCSTGGGASLEYLEGKVLPGVAFLET